MDSQSEGMLVHSATGEDGIRSFEGDTGIFITSG